MLLIWLRDQIPRVAEGRGRFSRGWWSCTLQLPGSWLEIQVLWIGGVAGVASGSWSGWLPGSSSFRHLCLLPYGLLLSCCWAAILSYFTSRQPSCLSGELLCFISLLRLWFCIFMHKFDLYWTIDWYLVDFLSWTLIFYGLFAPIGTLNICSDLFACSEVY